MILKNLGHRVLLASSGEEAIDIIKNSKSKIDGIFLDLMMPKVGGFDVLTFMRDSFITIPVVVQTGLINNKDIEKAIKVASIDEQKDSIHKKAIIDRSIPPHGIEKQALNQIKKRNVVLTYSKHGKHRNVPRPEL